MTTRTRLARAADIDAVSELAWLAFRHYTTRIGRPPFPVSADYAGLVRAGTTWVAEEDGSLTGFVVLLDRPDHVWLDIIAVAPHAQGRGVGTQLLRLAEQQAADRNLNEVRLCTNEVMTENLDYYPRRGYLETHRDAQDGFRRVYFAKVLGSS